MFNSLKYVKKLEEAGVPREQAEAQIYILTEIMTSHFATSQDLKDLGQELREEMKTEFSSVRTDLALLAEKIIQSEQRMTIRLGTIVSLSMGVAVTLMKLVS